MNSTREELATIDQTMTNAAAIRAGVAPASPAALRDRVAEARSKAIAETRASVLFGRASVALGNSVMTANVCSAMIEALVAHVEALERRLSEIPVMTYEGVFAAEREYMPGQCVTWGGNVYIAQAKTSKKPDSPESGWRLAVRRGRDARNARP